MSPGRRANQRKQTRRTLLSESRQLFSARGYGAVGLSEIVEAAGVTKGALYHHFDSKAGLFRAVLEQVQREVADEVVASADAVGDPWTQLIVGCRAFLSARAGSRIQRIMLIDGPAVIGWSEWRALDEAASAHHLAETLTALIEAGTIAPQPVAPLTRLLSGAMNEAALWLAGSTNPGDLTDTWAALSKMLDALRLR